MIPRVLTYEEWLQMPPVEDGTDEVVKGELRFMPPTRYPHAEIIQRLITFFTKQLDETKVSILGSNFGLMISRDPLTCRSPDIALNWREKMVIQDGLYFSPPDLIVEVISSSETRRRKEEKLGDYATISVPEVWLIAPETRSVETRVLAAGRFAPANALREGTVEPVRFPGASIPIAAIWPA
jgi:Uma2 family endonuclease